MVDPLAREVLRTVEGNVLQEVSQPLLAILLLHRADTLHDVELGTLLRLRIMADEVGQSIRKLADTHGRVNRQFITTLSPSRLRSKATHSSP